MGESVLLVEDDALSAEFMRLFLESNGFNVIAVGTLGLAKAEILRSCPRNLITDIQLPDGSGIDIAIAAKSAGCAKVIGVTGYESSQLSANGVDISAFDKIFSKPIELQELALELAA